MDLSTAIALPKGDRAARKPTALEEEVVGLFDELRIPLLRYLMSLGLNEHDGEEVVQEAFLALFRHLRKGGRRDNLRGWIFKVGHNLGLKLRQRANARAGVTPADPVDSGLNPEEQALRNQRTRRLQAVLNALPETDRACLLLRAEGLRYREIAEVLGMSLGNVAQSLARGLARMARADGGSL